MTQTTADSTLEVLDGAGAQKYMKGMGTGASGDPFIPHRVIKEQIYNESNLVHEYLLATAAKNLGVDGSAVPVTYSAKPASGKLWLISKIFIFLQDGSALTPSTFGNITALTNGLSIKLNNTEIFNFKDNLDIQMAGSNVHGDAAYALSDKTLFTCIDLARMDAGQQRGVEALTTYGVSAVVQDDISGLSACRITIQGKEFTV